MSVERIAQVLNTAIGVSPTAKLVLLGIANHDGDGGAWPSIATLARYAETSERTVQRVIKDLETRGLVEVVRNAGGTARMRSDRRPNLYRLHFHGVTSDVTPSESRGDIPRAHGVTSDAPRGDIAVSPEPSLNHPVKPPTLTNTTEIVHQGFDRWECFWKQYPRKHGKAEARKRWSKMKPEEHHDALRALDVWVPYYATIEAQYVPHASTWLNQRRWEDDPPVTARRQAPGMAAVRARLKEAQ